METTIMSNNTFFASEGLEELFLGDPPNLASVRINGFEGKFISFDQRRRSLSFDIGVDNPFDVIKSEDNTLRASIEFLSGATRVVLYESFVFKIKQNNKTFIITVEDIDK